MTTCKECFHYKACAAMLEADGFKLPDDFGGGAERCEDFIATANVAPRSEVDKWKEINKQLHKEMSERMSEERKIERKLVVTQIMCEILANHTPDIIDGFFTMHETELAELKKKYIGE